jgi:two-component system nitrogen regulation response regulator GlnG
LGRASAEQAITADVLAILCKKPWPGNVRELRNTIEQAHLMSRGEKIHASHLQSSYAEIRNDQGEATMQQSVLRWIEGELLSMDENDEGLYEKFLALVEPVLFEATLKSTKGSIAGASQRLGLHRGTLRERLKRHSIEP